VDKDVTKKESDLTIDVKLFASSREIIGKNKITLKLTDQMTTVRDLRKAILELYPSLHSSKIYFAIAVNHKVATDTTALNHLDEVALLPPISGG
jgi:molybdopterin converting factor subunit 1